MAKRGARSYAKIFSSSISGVSDEAAIQRVVSAFVHMLVRERAIFLGEQIIEHVADIEKKSSGVMNGTLYIRHEKDADRVCTALSKALNKKIEVKVKEDMSIIGGGKLITEESIFDATLAGQIHSARVMLLES